MKTNSITIESPGRICLFGDHQDYLGLPVIACAIDRYIRIIGEPNHSDYLKIKFLDLGRTRDIPINKIFDVIDKSDFFGAVLKLLRKKGCIPDKGYDIEIRGDVPINAGLSSSSALVVGWAKFLVHAFGKAKDFTSADMAQIAYEAEVLEQGSPGGKMDQYSIGIGDIIYLETGEHTKFQIVGNALEGLVVGESGIPKDTLGLLGNRKSLALEAIHFLSKRFPDFDLSEITKNDYKAFESVLHKEHVPYFYAAVHNHIITKKALGEFKKGLPNIKYVGELMNEHHNILKNVLKITVPRIDDMILAALKAGALGAKIVGSGGGGSICAIAPNNGDEVAEAIKNAGAVNAYKIKVSKGTRMTR